MTETTVDTYDNESDWLEARKGSLGASEVAAALGINPFCSQLKLYCRHTGEPEVFSDEEKVSMAIGHAMEPVIAGLYQAQTQRKTCLDGFTIERRDDLPWLHSSPDATVTVMTPGKDVMELTVGRLEIKNVGPHMVRAWENGPPHYVECQLQTALLISGCEWGSVAAMLAGTEFACRDYVALPDVHEQIIKLTQQFWLSVKRRDPPPARADDVDLLKRLFPRHAPGKTVTLDDEALRAAHELANVKSRIKWMKRKKSAHEAMLKQQMGDAEVGELPDGEKIKWPSVEIAEHVVKAYPRRTLYLPKAYSPKEA